MDLFIGNKKSLKITSRNGWSYEIPKIKGEEDKIKILNKDNNGLTFQAIKSGWANIKIKEEGLATTSYYVYRIHVIEPIKEIKFENEPKSVKIGDKFELNAHTYPDNYIENGCSIKKGYGSLKWKSMTPNTASVNSEGIVSIIGYGDIEIRAIYHGGVSDGTYATFKYNLQNINSGGSNSNNSGQSTKLKYYEDGRTINTTGGYKITGQRTWNLTDRQKRYLAYVAIEEMGGSVDNMRMTLSLMANLTDRDGWNSIYEYVQSDEWFGYPDYDYSVSGGLDIVEDVIVNGNRYLPTYVDEYDMFDDGYGNSDIVKATNNGVEINSHDRQQYIPNVTIVYNNSGSVWKFIGFAPNGGDPFGTTNF